MPTREEIDECMKEVMKVLPFELENDKEHLTQLETSFLRSWVLASGGPDKYVIDWLE